LLPLLLLERCTAGVVLTALLLRPFADTTGLDLLEAVRAEYSSPARL